MGERIQRIRQQRGISQRKLAKMLGLSAPMFSYYESGQTGIDADFLSKIADALDVPVRDLVEDAPGATRSFSPTALALLNQIETFLEQQKGAPVATNESQDDAQHPMLKTRAPLPFISPRELVTASSK